MENPACSAESRDPWVWTNYVNWGEERASKRRGIRNSTLGRNLGFPHGTEKYKRLKHLEMVILDVDLCVGEL